jgi:hypothetical protein
MKAKTLILTAIAVSACIRHASAAQVTGDSLKIGTSSGASHNLSGTGSSIAAGDANKNSGDYSIIGGGQNNTNSGNWSFIGSGGLNVNSGGGGVFIGAGYGNIISPDNNGLPDDQASAIVGGLENAIFVSEHSFIGGGEENTITNFSGHSVIAGGGYNLIVTNYGTIAGGQWNAIVAGDYSTIAGGYYNTNNAPYGTIGGGSHNLAEGTFSTVPGGAAAYARLYGQVAHANGGFGVGGNGTGQAQASEYILRGVTTTSTPTELFLDNAAARMTVPSGQSWTFNILVVARGTTGGNTAGYQVAGVIENNGGTTSLVGSASKTVLGEDVPAWDITVSADDTNDALVINATGDNSTIRWVATVRTAEVAL